MYLHHQMLPYFLTNEISGNPATKRDQSNYTALHYAARKGSVECCKLLLTHGADVNAQVTKQLSSVIQVK